MNKINGYTEEEAIELVNYITSGKKAGNTLSGLFASYAQKSGRASANFRYLCKLNRKDGVPLSRVVNPSPFGC